MHPEHAPGTQERWSSGSHEASVLPSRSHCVTQYGMIRNDDSVETLLTSVVQRRGNTGLSNILLHRPTMTWSPLVI